MFAPLSIRRDRLLLTLCTLLPLFTGCAVIPGPYGIPKFVGMSAETAAVVQRANRQEVTQAVATRRQIPSMHLAVARTPTAKAPENVHGCELHAQQHVQQHVQPPAAVEHAVAIVPHQEQPVAAESALTVVNYEQPVQPLKSTPTVVETPAAPTEEPGVVLLSSHSAPVPPPTSAPRRVPRRLASHIQSPTRQPQTNPVSVASASELVSPPTMEVIVPPVPQQTVSLAIPPCGPCEEKPAPPPPQIHTDQIAELMKRVTSMEQELQSSNQSIATLHKALMKANAEVKRLNASVAHWQSEVKRLEIAMQTQHETDIESLNRISEMLGVLADIDGDTENDQGTR